MGRADSVYECAFPIKEKDISDLLPPQEQDRLLRKKTWKFRGRIGGLTIAGLGVYALCFLADDAAALFPQYGAGLELAARTLCGVTGTAFLISAFNTYTASGQYVLDVLERNP